MQGELHFREIERGMSLVVQKWDERRAEKARERGRRSDSSNANGRSVYATEDRKEDRTLKWANSNRGSYPTSLGLNAGASEFVATDMSRNVSGNSMWSNGTGETSFEDESQIMREGSRRGSLVGTTKAKGGEGIDPCKLTSPPNAEQISLTL